MRLRSFPILALCLLAACGGGPDARALTNEGARALNSGKYKDAESHFEKALASIGNDTSHPEWKQAKLGLYQAQAATDAAKAKDGFLEFARSNPSSVTDTDFDKIAGRLGDAGKFEEAIDLLKVAKATYPDSTHLDALGEALAKQAKASGAADALAALKGLGYGGE